MSNFVPTKQHLREVLLHYFILKKSAAESYRLLVEFYGDNAPSERSCREWFQRFRNGDYDVNDKERSGAPKKFEDKELETLLDEDPRQTLKELSQSLNVDESTVSKRLKVIGMIHQQDYWLPRVLKDRDIERRLVMCELLLQRQNRKSFLHRIVTGGEKWIYYDNQKRTKSFVKPGQPASLTAKRDIHGSKVMLSIWWDQNGVIYYELLEPNETITAIRYRKQIGNLSRALKEKRQIYAISHDKVILQQENAKPHVARLVKEALALLGWDVLPHPPYSPDLAPSDYHLFRSMQHSLSEQHFSSYEEIKNWLDEWIASKEEHFFSVGIRLLPVKWQYVIANDGKYCE